MNLRVAIVHDDFIQHGGAERLVLAMLEIWPQADLYGVMVTDQWQEEIKNKFGKEVRTSWLQKLPFKAKLFRQYYSLYPLAIESFRFNDYDLVVSSSARYAHGIITKPPTPHVAYVNSPARFLWDDSLIPSNVFLKPVINWHCSWDRVASKRPDYVIANSKTPAERIEKYWGRKADAIIYPFVDLNRFTTIDSIGLDPLRGTNLQGSYLLVVSRLNRWKNVDLAIQACNDLELPLVVVGQGEDEGRLKSLAGSTISFTGEVADEDLVHLYKNCRSLIQTQEEDFGITALEAQAVGKPVIALGKGGALETIQAGVTGVYFTEPTPQSLKQVLAQFDERKYLRENCQRQAEKFGKERFQSDLKNFITNVLLTG